MRRQGVACPRDAAGEIHHHQKLRGFRRLEADEAQLHPTPTAVDLLGHPGTRTNAHSTTASTRQGTCTSSHTRRGTQARLAKTTRDPNT